MPRAGSHSHLHVIALVSFAMSVSACNKVHLYAKHASSQEAAIFVARQSPLLEMMHPTQLRFELPADGRLVITFSSMGVVQVIDPNNNLVPPVAVQCRLDNKPCVTTDDATVQFRFPPERPQVWTYDTRAYTWVVANAAKGAHTVDIWAMLGFPEVAKLVTLNNWSLVVQAFDN